MGLVYVTINTALFVATSVPLLISYYKFYGIKTGINYFMLLGISNAPAGFVEKLKTEEGNMDEKIQKISVFIFTNNSSCTSSVN